MRDEMTREVEPELLDELDPSDPRAIQSRRDLRRINALMRHPRMLAGMLKTLRRNAPPKRIADLGAGDGLVMLRIAERLAPDWGRVEVLLVDRQKLLRPETSDQFRAFGWNAVAIPMDVAEFLACESSLHSDVMIANLFLHHFSTPGLQNLLALASRRTRLFLACEPRRSAWSMLGARLLRVIGCNAVTRHDAVLSVKAGFRGDELSQLWPQSEHWRTREGRAGIFGHMFVADRVA